MKDYEITVKVRNNYLLTAMRAKGLFTGADLCRACGVRQTTIGHYLNLKMPALTKAGEWRASILIISECLGVPPASLFPQQHIDEALAKNTASFECSFDDLAALNQKFQETPLLPDAGLEQRDMENTIDTVLGELRPRERYVLEQRFGLEGGEKRTLKDIGNELGISKDRVCQLEARALRQLKRPSRAKSLKETAAFDNEWNG